MGTGHNLRRVFFIIIISPPLENGQTADSTHEDLRPSHALFPGELKRSLEETKRLGFFKNVYPNVRKAYFDRTTTLSEFCFETNILCNRRSV